jgi:hypothetical protein|tara:strand:- start:56 stop:418 length:363 start_codon:yes stop_codon:yes gene_type:complete
MTKYCNKCKSTKDSSLFYKCSSKKDKKASNCKKCDDIAKNNWRKNNPKKVKSYEKYRWRNTDKKEKDLKRALNHRLNMSDLYIRELMTKKFKGLDPKDIPDDLVIIYRENLRLKRKLKDS